MREYSKEIAGAIKTFMNDNQWRFVFDEEIGVLRFEIAMKGIMRKLSYWLRIIDDGYFVSAISSIGADPNDHEMMSEMCGLICRANYGYTSGHFALDFKSGEVSFDEFIDCSGGIIPTQEIIGNSLFTPALKFERYSLGIVGIALNKQKAEEAFEMCENDTKGQ